MPSSSHRLPPPLPPNITGAQGSPSDRSNSGSPAPGRSTQSTHRPHHSSRSAQQPTLSVLQRRGQIEHIPRLPIYIENPPRKESPPEPHEGTEQVYKDFRKIIEQGEPNEAVKFYTEHPEIQLGPLVEHSTMEQLAKILPLMALNRFHPKFDIHIYSSVQCRVLHHELNIALNTMKELNAVYAAMDDFIKRYQDIDVEKFISSLGIKFAVGEEKIIALKKIDAISRHMRPDHPLYETVRYGMLDHTVDSDVDHIRLFFQNNPGSKHAVLNVFSSAADAGKLATVLPYIHPENEYRPKMEERVIKFLVEEREPEDFIDFLSDKKNKNINLYKVWTAVIDFGRDDLAEELEGNNLLPGNDSLADLLAHANRKNQPKISELLQYLMEDQGVEHMDVDADSSGSTTPSSR